MFVPAWDPLSESWALKLSLATSLEKQELLKGQ